jgi:hypothetical protein
MLNNYWECILALILNIKFHSMIPHIRYDTLLHMNNESLVMNPLFGIQ